MVLKLLNNTRFSEAKLLGCFYVKSLPHKRKLAEIVLTLRPSKMSLFLHLNRFGEM